MCVCALHNIIALRSHLGQWSWTGFAVMEEPKPLHGMHGTLGLNLLGMRVPVMVASVMSGPGSKNTEALGFAHLCNTLPLFFHCLA